eukprot:289803-Chlamydomonas_euryale.AAC.2
MRKLFVRAPPCMLGRVCKRCARACRPMRARARRGMRAHLPVGLGRRQKWDHGASLKVGALEHAARHARGRMLGAGDPHRSVAVAWLST